MATGRVLGRKSSDPLNNGDVIVTEQNGIVNININHTINASGSVWSNVCSVPQPSGISYYFFPLYNNTDGKIANARISGGVLAIDCTAGSKNYRGATTYMK